MKTIRVKELEIPTDIIIEVANILKENQIEHTLLGGDEDEDTLSLEIKYEKEDSGAIHEIIELIDDYHDEDHEEEGEEDQD